MADTPATTEPGLTGKVPFYQKPEPLSREAHGKLGVKRIEKPMLFASTTHVVPITLGEFAQVALDYPIVFAGDDNVPLAVMGLRPNENLFVSEDGEFEPDCYIPAFIRRYPFVFAEDPANDRFVACIDVEAASVQENADFPFFENGEPTKFTTDAIEFLKLFEQQRRQTQLFVEAMKELDFFETRTVNFQPTNADGSQGEPNKIADYVGLSGAKLEELSADKLVELRDNGAFASVLIQNLSTNNWQRLINRASRRNPEGTPPVTN